MARVVLAMSGGVDSSVSAVLLKQQGHEVIGLFMRTGVHTPEPTCDTTPDPKAHKKGCCSAVDAGDARRVADRLDIPFYALDFEDDFGRIIDYFTDEYLAGRTPNPCVMCNNWLKFGKLWSFGKQLDADYIATGHYAQVLRGPTGDAQLHRGADPEKDQSYVLHGIRRKLLDKLLFPVGGFRKEEIRAMARDAGLNVAQKPDSVEICFVPDNDHAGLIRRRVPERIQPGEFVDRQGHVLGKHDGIEAFTIGQRKGLGVATGSRRYVLEIIPESRQVVLGDADELLAPGLEASRINWLIDIPESGLRCEIKIRYRHTPAPGTITATPTGGAIVQFDEPQSAITPGQAVVFYDGPRVLGGGWIEHALPPA
ncbi:tRNA 2-thiouridine(34) synthase MnmA [Tuwongella immobilis]|uniref:tRNA-specific 2-thiouridylase MnmA n=1 Tax=Tuwongella immobilis TaxID=692036 RepID=A0A6C2YVH3_9BACT|nr:tRNA 2-thiouridine(34) synthase MnmA [Tuwongella immobilis]VIP05620.1 trna (5-methylaminomethyl-2-thiouridylate)-methyltransferase : tRNA-specific 2-thiouridylase MnmA OS=Planctomyces brasiliensis (strain ATCC 49424 / DSM 5305 / JCM 21570 / NBRC 103401 / IFAM 1448) GN=mnmA PE=3 SV=1: tRNA_Me_trans [Tuwongella immobilis]VTS08596.1 trna (5-methylaminomethyl-2-thiouridylate)-methyltransferase : tRNA-specific 2-thiouridylase MnmA OS=Planctomyces brasiliensis (strain ATCC 49424 / DSM 5305 / JCM 215